MGAGGDEQLVIALAQASFQQHLFGFTVQAHGGYAPEPLYAIGGGEVRPGKVQPLQAPLFGEVLVENAAGIDMVILGDQRDLPVPVQPPQLAHGVDARGGSAEYHVFHACTSTSVMACMGHFSTHMGLGVTPSSLRWTHMLHFMISFCRMLSYFRIP